MPPKANGRDLIAMFSSALDLLELNVDDVNRLNVFPVPDGDTGVNMFLSLGEIVAQARKSESTSVSQVSRLMSDTALRSARGNSGVILSQLFRGFADYFEDMDEFGPADLAEAFTPAAVAAYAATGHPREGTILTVIREVSERAQNSDADSFAGLLEEVCETALDSVARTPGMLLILREAGVVDAGGYGLYIILEGMRLCASGLEVESRELSPPEPVGVDGSGNGISKGFLDSIESEEYGYCTQFVIEGHDMDLPSIMVRLGEIGNSAVVIGDVDLIRVHVHALDSAPVIEYGGSIGEVGQINIQNMDDQRRDYSRQLRSELGDNEIGEVSVIAVAWGEGLESVFRECGVSQIIQGGDTLNPSVRQILEAVEDAPTSDVLILPNNPNITTTAQQAVSLTSKNLSVVPTSTIPEGIAAALEFDGSKSLAGNLEQMQASMGDIRTVEICKAVRPVDLNGVRVGDDQIIGLLDRQLVSTGDTVGAVLADALSKSVTEETELVTLFRGEPITESEAEQTVQTLETRFPDIEFELIHGGQPHYHFLVSVE
jgi:DAK2 domain fusion protein YloV